MSVNNHLLRTEESIIKDSLQSLVILHTFSVLLIPLLIALFYYSTPRSRRQPIFILNVLALSLAFIVGVIGDAMNVQIAIGFTGSFQAMLADAILLVRLITVHPPSRIGRLRFALLMFVPITLKVARLINLSLYIHQMSIITRNPNAFEHAASAWLTLPYVKIEWIAQVVDNGYVSIAFLWTIWRYRARTSSSGLVSTLTFRQSSFMERIRILFHLSLSNFIIPTIISIVQLALLFQIGAANPVLLNDIASVNTKVSSFGVVFATVWAGMEHRREAQMCPSNFQAEHARRPMQGLESDITPRPLVSIASVGNYQSDITSSTSEKVTVDQSSR
ncbi:hypothetical protein JVU11DRAFT_7197 [Chiua virens]|nr:hypothetical protein JVU11DRAFT_7197 [Chiua virens]